MKSPLISIHLNINQGLLKSRMEANNTHDTKSESTPGHLHNTKFSMEPMSNLANIKPKLGCRLGEFGTPDSIHGARQTLWLDQLGSTKPSCLQEAQGSPCLPPSSTQPLVLLVRRRLSPKLAQSFKLGSGNPFLPPRAPRLSRLSIF